MVGLRTTALSHDGSDCLPPLYRARELVRQQEQIASLQQELEDTKERMHRDALDYAAANAGTGRNDGAAASGGVALRGSGGKVWQPLSIPRHSW